MVEVAATETRGDNDRNGSSASSQKCGGAAVGGSESVSKAHPAAAPAAAGTYSGAVFAVTVSTLVISFPVDAVFLSTTATTSTAAMSAAAMQSAAATMLSSAQGSSVADAPLAPSATTVSAAALPPLLKSFSPASTLPISSPLSAGSKYNSSLPFAGVAFVPSSEVESSAPALAAQAKENSKLAVQKVPCINAPSVCWSQREKQQGRLDSSSEKREEGRMSEAFATATPRHTQPACVSAADDVYARMQMLRRRWILNIEASAKPASTQGEGSVFCRNVADSPACLQDAIEKVVRLAAESGARRRACGRKIIRHLQPSTLMEREKSCMPNSDTQRPAAPDVGEKRGSSHPQNGQPGTEKRILKSVEHAEVRTSYMRPCETALWKTETDDSLLCSVAAKAAAQSAASLLQSQRLFLDARSRWNLLRMHASPSPLLAQVEAATSAATRSTGKSAMSAAAHCPAVAAETCKVLQTEEKKENTLVTRQASHAAGTTGDRSCSPLSRDLLQKYNDGSIADRQGAGSEIEKKHAAEAWLEGRSQPQYSSFTPAECSACRAGKDASSASCPSARSSKGDVLFQKKHSSQGSFVEKAAAREFGWRLARAAAKDSAAWPLFRRETSATEAPAWEDREEAEAVSTEARCEEEGKAGAPAASGRGQKRTTPQRGVRDRDKSSLSYRDAEGDAREEDFRMQRQTAATTRQARSFRLRTASVPAASEVNGSPEAQFHSQLKRLEKQAAIISERRRVPCVTNEAAAAQREAAATAVSHAAPSVGGSAAATSARICRSDFGRETTLAAVSSADAAVKDSSKSVNARCACALHPEISARVALGSITPVRAGGGASLPMDFALAAAAATAGREAVPIGTATAAHEFAAGQHSAAATVGISRELQTTAEARCGCTAADAAAADRNSNENRCGAGLHAAAAEDFTFVQESNKSLQHLPQPEHQQPASLALARGDAPSASPPLVRISATRQLYQALKAGKQQREKYNCESASEGTAKERAAESLTADSLLWGNTCQGEGRKYQKVRLPATTAAHAGSSTASKRRPTHTPAAAEAPTRGRPRREAVATVTEEGGAAVLPPTEVSCGYVHLAEQVRAVPARTGESGGEKEATAAKRNEKYTLRGRQRMAGTSADGRGTAAAGNRREEVTTHQILATRAAAANEIAAEAATLRLKENAAIDAGAGQEAAAKGKVESASIDGLAAAAAEERAAAERERHRLSAFKKSEGRSAAGAAPAAADKTAFLSEPRVKAAVDISGAEAASVEKGALRGLHPPAVQREAAREGAEAVHNKTAKVGVEQGASTAERGETTATFSLNAKPFQQNCSLARLTHHREANHGGKETEQQSKRNVLARGRDAAVEPIKPEDSSPAEYLQRCCRLHNALPGAVIALEKAQRSVGLIQVLTGYSSGSCCREVSNQCRRKAAVATVICSSPAATSELLDEVVTPATIHASGAGERKSLGEAAAGTVRAPTAGSPSGTVWPLRAAMTAGAAQQHSRQLLQLTRVESRLPRHLFRSHAHSQSCCAQNRSFFPRVAADAKGGRGQRTATSMKENLPLQAHTGFRKGKIPRQPAQRDQAPRGNAREPADSRSVENAERPAGAAAAATETGLRKQHVASLATILATARRPAVVLPPVLPYFSSPPCSKPSQSSATATFGAAAAMPLPLAGKSAPAAASSADLEPCTIFRSAGAEKFEATAFEKRRATLDSAADEEAYPRLPAAITPAPAPSPAAHLSPSVAAAAAAAAAQHRAAAAASHPASTAAAAAVNAVAVERGLLALVESGSDKLSGIARPRAPAQIGSPHSFRSVAERALPRNFTLLSSSSDLPYSLNVQYCGSYAPRSSSQPRAKPDATQPHGRSEVVVFPRLSVGREAGPAPFPPPAALITPASAAVAASRSSNDAVCLPLKERHTEFASTVVEEAAAEEGGETCGVRDAVQAPTASVTTTAATEVAATAAAEAASIEAAVEKCAKKKAQERTGDSQFLLRSPVAAASSPTIAPKDAGSQIYNGKAVCSATLPHIPARVCRRRSRATRHRRSRRDCVSCSSRSSNSKMIAGYRCGNRNSSKIKRGASPCYGLEDKSEGRARSSCCHLSSSSSSNSGLSNSCSSGSGLSSSCSGGDGYSRSSSRRKKRKRKTKTSKMHLKFRPTPVALRTSVGLVEEAGKQSSLPRHAGENEEASFVYMRRGDFGGSSSSATSPTFHRSRTSCSSCRCNLQRMSSVEVEAPLPEQQQQQQNKTCCDELTIFHADGRAQLQKVQLSQQQQGEAQQQEPACHAQQPYKSHEQQQRSAASESQQQPEAQQQNLRKGSARHHHQQQQLPMLSQPPPQQQQQLQQRKHMHLPLNYQAGEHCLKRLAKQEREGKDEEQQQQQQQPDPPKQQQALTGLRWSEEQQRSIAKPVCGQQQVMQLIQQDQLHTEDVGEKHLSAEQTKRLLRSRQQQHVRERQQKTAEKTDFKQKRRRRQQNSLQQYSEPLSKQEACVGVPARAETSVDEDEDSLQQLASQSQNIRHPDQPSAKQQQEAHQQQQLLLLQREELPRQAMQGPLLSLQREYIQKKVTRPVTEQGEKSWQRELQQRQLQDRTPRREQPRRPHEHLREQQERNKGVEVNAAASTEGKQSEGWKDAQCAWGDGTAAAVNSRAERLQRRISSREERTESSNDNTDCNITSRSGRNCCSSSRRNSSTSSEHMYSRTTGNTSSALLQSQTTASLSGGRGTRVEAAAATSSFAGKFIKKSSSSQQESVIQPAAGAAAAARSEKAAPALPSDALGVDNAAGVDVALPLRSRPRLSVAAEASLDLLPIDAEAGAAAAANLPGSEVTASQPAAVEHHISHAAADAAVAEDTAPAAEFLIASALNASHYDAAVAADSTTADLRKAGVEIGAPPSLIAFPAIRVAAGGRCAAAGTKAASFSSPGATTATARKQYRDLTFLTAQQKSMDTASSSKISAETLPSSILTGDTAPLLLSARTANLLAQNSAHSRVAPASAAVGASAAAHVRAKAEGEVAAFAMLKIRGVAAAAGPREDRSSVKPGAFANWLSRDSNQDSFFAAATAAGCAFAASGSAAAAAACGDRAAAAKSASTAGNAAAMCRHLGTRAATADPTWPVKKFQAAAAAAGVWTEFENASPAAAVAAAFDGQSAGGVFCKEWSGLHRGERRSLSESSMFTQKLQQPVAADRSKGIKGRSSSCCSIPESSATEIVLRAAAAAAARKCSSEAAAKAASPVAPTTELAVTRLDSRSPAASRHSFAAATTGRAAAEAQAAEAARSADAPEAADASEAADAAANEQSGTTVPRVRLPSEKTSPGRTFSGSVPAELQDERYKKRNECNTPHSLQRILTEQSFWMQRPQLQHLSPQQRQQQHRQQLQQLRLPLHPAIPGSLPRQEQQQPLEDREACVALEQQESWRRPRLSLTLQPQQPQVQPALITVHQHQRPLCRQLDIQQPQEEVYVLRHQLSEAQLQQQHKVRAGLLLAQLQQQQQPTAYFLRPQPQSSRNILQQKQQAQASPLVPRLQQIPYILQREHLARLLDKQCLRPSLPQQQHHHFLPQQNFPVGQPLRMQRRCRTEPRAKARPLGTQQQQQLLQQQSPRSIASAAFIAVPSVPRRPPASGEGATALDATPPPVTPSIVIDGQGGLDAAAAAAGGRSIKAAVDVLAADAPAAAASAAATAAGGSALAEERQQQRSALPAAAAAAERQAQWEARVNAAKKRTRERLRHMLEEDLQSTSPSTKTESWKYLSLLRCAYCKTCWQNLSVKQQRRYGAAAIWLLTGVLLALCAVAMVCLVIMKLLLQEEAQV